MAGAVEPAQRRDQPQETLHKLGRLLNQDALTIGFARRFATYKRANLVLKDIEKLASMVNHPRRAAVTERICTTFSAKK